MSGGCRHHTTSFSCHGPHSRLSVARNTVWVCVSRVWGEERGWIVSREEGWVGGYEGSLDIAASAKTPVCFRLSVRRPTATRLVLLLYVVVPATVAPIHRHCDCHSICVLPIPYRSHARRRLCKRYQGTSATVRRRYARCKYPAYGLSVVATKCVVTYIMSEMDMDHIQPNLTHQLTDPTHRTSTRTHQTHPLNSQANERRYLFMAWHNA